jgi:Ca-activated chloride channel homolog
MIVPLALLGLASLPIIVAFYMLRLRRRDVPVGSTFLWQQLVRDVEANAPWQRLRFSWLLLVQLLIAALLVLAAARPFLTVPSELAANVVLIVDTSASMGAVDPGGERISAAREAARKVIGQLPVGGRVTVVAADDSAHVLVSETDDRAAALAAIDGITATQLPGDLTDAFALASALAARDADSSVVVVTDATADRLPSLGIGAPIHVERVGSGNRNQTIAALSVMRRAGGAQLDLFVAVSNTSSADASRRLEIYADGALVDARDLSVPAGQRSEALVSTVPAAAQLVEARLAGADQLAVDDRAFALVPQTGAVRALLVSEGNSYLESALALLPRLELYAVAPDGLSQTLAAAEKAGTPYGLLIFDRYVPATPPRVPSLYVAPAKDGPFGTVGKAVEGPLVGRTDPDEPLLRFVDLTALHIGRALTVVLSEPMRSVVESTDGTPLLAAGRVDGQPLALLTFALGESDLPLQVAFPLLVSNLTDFLLPAVDGVLPPSLPLGVPIDLALDPSLASATLVDNGVQTTIPLAGGHGTLPGATRVGIRELRDPAGATLGRVAANLFDPAESNIAPGDPRRLVEMGRVGPTDAAAQQPSRAEWWWPLALVGLALLAVEWLLFHRPTRSRLNRMLRRGAAASAR